MAKKAKKKVVKKAKRGRGQPTKFDENMRERMEPLYLKGFTDKEVAHAVGINEATLTNWKKAHPDFFVSLSDWKIKADQVVVKSLYERAQGYSHPETKAQWVNGSEGEPGRWETIEMVRHYPPDPTSMIYWTKNRMPKEWRDKVDTEISGEVTVTIVDYAKVDE